MQFTTATLGFLAAAAGTVSAQAGTTIKVQVGNGALVYSPNDIQAAVGTQVEFQFFPKNHTVTQSSFADPCHPLAAGGFFSGFVPTASADQGSTFTITVNDTKPIWIYCGQTTGNHCQSGMVAAINAPKTGNTLDAFKLLAKNATLSSSPPTGPVGGVLNLKSAPSNGTTTTGGSGSSTTTTVTTSVVTTIITTISNPSTTYATTYPSTIATTYTTALAGSSSTSSAPLTQSTGAAGKMAVAGGSVAGAAIMAAFAML